MHEQTEEQAQKERDRKMRKEKDEGKKKQKAYKWIRQRTNKKTKEGPKGSGKTEKPTG